MFQLIAEKLNDQQFVVSVLVGFAVIATILSIAMPLLASDGLERRMKSVAVERDLIRARERERMARNDSLSLIRQAPKAYMKQVVVQFKLSDWLGTETAKDKLLMAGFRGQQAEIGFLFFRLVAPISLLLFSLFYIFVLKAVNQPTLIKFGIVIFAVYLGIKVPEIFLNNAIQKRQLQIRRAWPDSLDLLLICVESGMSVEQSFRRVGQEVGTQSVALAEELTLTTAELSYLPERRVAYDNLAKRTGIEPVKSITTALIQAERYGTPVGNALRVLAQESRDQRMNEVEKKAAALPPKLTVPMILFFLPVLFVVILIPAMIPVMGWK